MAVKIRFTSAFVSGVVLAKVGNPLKEEPLQTSKHVSMVSDDDVGTLTALFIKPFKNLIAHRFTHHSSLEKHEINQCARTIFEKPSELLAKGQEIAKRLYSKSNHPNIKAGDLCIALIEDIDIEGQMTQGLCILKSETVVPFLSISSRDGDLQLSTEHGINPEKIDKGCLIVNHFGTKGFYVLTFDRSGETKFWFRDFLGVQAVPDSAFLTNTYASMAVEFMEQEQPAEVGKPEENGKAAREAIDFFENKENFDLQEFEKEVLKTPDAVAKFADHRAKIEEEQGVPLEKSFAISKKDVNKAKKKIVTVMRLDSGIEIHLKPVFATQKEPVLERGFDEGKKMKFIKVFFHKDLNNDAPGQ